MSCSFLPHDALGYSAKCSLASACYLSIYLSVCLLPGEHGEILERQEVGLALVHSFGTASATPFCFRRWVVPLLLDHTNIGSVLHNKMHCVVMFAIAQLSCVYYNLY